MSQSFTRGVPIDPDPTLSNNSDLLVASQQATKTYVDNGLLTKQNVIGYTPVDKGGDTMIGNLILNADPTVGLQAATKQYVDTLVNKEKRSDWVSPYSYCGTAPLGSAEAASVWLIYRITCYDDGTVLVQSASAVDWTNRYTHTYT